MVETASVHQDIVTKGLNTSFMQETEHVAARSPCISRDDVLIIVKKSRLERDLEKKGLSQEELLAHYEKMGEGGARILAGHLHNLDSIAICKKHLPEQQVVHLDDHESLEMISRYKVVVALGGDDFFKLIGHYVGGETCIIGVKSDPASRGALLPFDAEQVPELLEALEQGRYKVEKWTRPRLYVNGKDCGTATNEIVTGKGDFRLMSRHILDYRGVSVTQQSSGILVSNGAGSTGWYSSAGLYLGRHDRSFPKTSPQLRFELREPSVRIEEREGRREVILPPHVEGSVEQGEVLRITSLNDDDGIISRDSLDAIPFPRGSVAEISIDSEPLRVIVP